MPSTAIDVSQTTLPTAIRKDEDFFPAARICRSDDISIEQSCQWLAAHRQELLDEAHQHGAVLFRGFKVQDPGQFDQFIAAFELENFPYEQSLSNAVRVNFTERVFSANEAPSDVKIFLHHEMAQTPIYPSRLFFFCEIAAETGGATPLCRSDWLFDRMKSELPKFAADCKQKGLRYTNVMPAIDDAASGMGRSWQSTLRSPTKEEAESRLQTLGYQWEWLEDGCLKATTPVLPAVKTLADGRETFFNQLIAAFCGWKDTRNDPSSAIKFGDGSRLDPEDVLRVGELADEVTFDLAWEPGDVALVDNIVAMHGRRTFTGKRKILASLVAVETHGEA